jgi:hypothetical protein
MPVPGARTTVLISNEKDGVTMEAKNIHCPGCGKPASGRFCNHCGAALAGAGSAAQWNAQRIAPWAALGIASVSLAISLLAWFDRGSRVEQPATAMSSESAAAAFATPGAPVDLSSMSPRQAADRLFNRIMSASERGDQVEAMRFVPMALQAYAGLGALDNDARYHMALIHLVADDTAKARAQIDSLRKSTPAHLLAAMLEHQIAERGGNQGAAVRAAKTFLAAYAAEIATGRTEYQDHRGNIDRFRQAALAGTAARN